MIAALAMLTAAGALMVLRPNPDGTAVCKRSVGRKSAEFSFRAVSLLPPGYRCDYIGGSSVEDFDRNGWIGWGVVATAAGLGLAGLLLLVLVVTFRFDSVRT